MNWRYKSILQNTIASLPMSDALYYALQRTAGSLRPDCLDVRKWLQASSGIAKSLISGGYEISGKRLLEIGTGRTLTIPLGLWLCGAGPIVTVDLNRYLSVTLVEECRSWMLRNSAQVLEIFGELADTAVFQDRFQQFVAFSGGLEPFMRLTCIRYLSPADARQLPFPEGSFDVHFSHSVLEHVPPAEIIAILKEAKRLLAPGGVLFHNIDPSDHFAHDDASICKINFLRFTDEEWSRLAGNKYMYHNRLRARDFQQLFARVGLRVVHGSFFLDQNSLAVLKQGFPLDERFTGFSPEELAVTVLEIVGTFSPGPGEPNSAEQGTSEAGSDTQVCEHVGVLSQRKNSWRN